MMSFHGRAGEAAAAYQVGRQSAESDALRRDLLDTLFSPAAAQRDPGSLIAQNKALAAENEHLRAVLNSTERNLAGLESDYAELRAWADMASRKLKQYGL